MITNEHKLSAASIDIHSVNKKDAIWQTPVTILMDKYLPGECPIADDGGGISTLYEMLTEQWPADVHYLMYTHPSNTRLIKLNKQQRHQGINFNICALDLDYDNHHGKPGIDDFCNILTRAYVVDHTPNIVYQTRGGCRWLYLIEPMNNEYDFEDRFQSLVDQTAKVINQPTSAYKVDLAARDWTRLFRAPLVVRDAEEQYGYHVRVMHEDRLDLTTLTVKKKKPRIEYDGTAIYRGNDQLLINRLCQIRDGQRNRELYIAAIYILTKYRLEDHDKLLGVIRAQASSAGLDDREIEQTINSAAKRAERN